MCACLRKYFSCDKISFFFGNVRTHTELEILLMRSCFPIHPICAAIQSVGICQRDVEHDGTTKLGRALYPAVLLHGAFDFWLMILAVVDFIHAPDMEEEPTTAASSDGDQEKQTLTPPSLLALSISFLVTALGLAYYFWASRQQRGRLNALMANQDSSLSLALT